MEPMSAADDEIRYAISSDGHASPPIADSSLIAVRRVAPPLPPL